MTDKIIIAEDHVIIREALVQLLGQKYDVDIDTVGNGDSLVERVRDNEYSVVITDNAMPKRSGLSAGIQIRGFNQDVPIIMLSGSDIEEEALKAGVTHYISKPYGGEELYPILNQYLTERA